MKIILPIKMIGLNKWIKLCKQQRGGYSPANTYKQEIQIEIASHIKKQLKTQIREPVYISYLWVEENKRRDLDNIAFAKKFIQDALVNCGILENDGWKNIVGFSDDFAVDKENPRIEIEIIEVE